MTSPPHTPPLAPSECLGFSLRKTLRGFAQIYDEAFRPLGIKASQYNLLAAITHLGPVAQKDLAGFSQRNVEVELAAPGVGVPSPPAPSPPVGGVKIFPVFSDNS